MLSLRSPFFLIGSVWLMTLRLDGDLIMIHSQMSQRGRTTFMALGGLGTEDHYHHLRTAATSIQVLQVQARF